MLPPLQSIVGCVLLTLPVTGGVAKAQKEPNPLFPMISSMFTPAVPLAECPGGVVIFTMKEERDGKGGIKGKLILDPNRRTFNEFGEITGATERRLIELDYTLKFLKKKKVNLGPPHFEQERLVYEVRGNKIMTRLLLVRPADSSGFAQLLIPDRDGRWAYIVHLHANIPQPCHPGCFPAGTPVLTPQGPRPIHILRAGDAVTIVRADGTTAAGQVQNVFITRNHLVRVETAAGILFTTQTQPLVLADGRLRPAGELQPGDRIFRWQNGKRQAVTVAGVALTGREEMVYNLVLGGSEVFIAGGYLARSKPPAGATISALGRD
jgi:hypothetical protein